MITAKGHEASERHAPPTPLATWPERCRECGEALTPTALKRPEGRQPVQQCGCKEGPSW